MLLGVETTALQIKYSVRHSPSKGQIGLNLRLFLELCCLIILPILVVQL